MGPGWPAKDPGPRIFSLESSSKAESQCFPASAQEMLMSIQTCTLDLHLLGHSAMISTASNLINMMESKACHDHLGHHGASWRQLTVRGSRGWHFKRETELTTRWGFNETLIESRFRYLIGAVNTNRVAGGNFISEKNRAGESSVTCIVKQLLLGWQQLWSIALVKNWASKQVPLPFKYSSIISLKL